MHANLYLVVKGLALSYLFLAGLSLSAQTQSDLETERLLDISRREQKITQQLAADPEYYSEADLERQINALILAYSHYLSAHPDDLSALILYGKLLRRAGHHDQAFKVFLKADALDPQIAVVKQQIGNHLAETGNAKAALTFYLNAIELDPEVSIYHFAVGEILHNFRDQLLQDQLFSRAALDREMLNAFQAAVRLDPDNFDAQMRLGEAYYDLVEAEWGAALRHWQALRRATSDEASLRCQILDLHIMRVLGKLGRSAEARTLGATILHPVLQHSKQQVLDQIAPPSATE